MAGKIMTHVNVEQAIQIALEHHRQGRLGEAEGIYRKILSQVPQHADALHLLGLVAGSVGKRDEEIRLIQQAIAINPAVADYHSNLGNALREEGKLNEAIAAHRAAVAIKPDYAEARYNLANALATAGRTIEAIEEYRRTIELKPSLAEPYNNLGNALFASGKIDEAIAACREAIARKADYPEAHFNLGVALQARNEMTAAVASLKRAIALRGDFADAYYNLGNVLHDCDELEPAIEAYRKAIELKSDFAECWSNLGIALRDAGRLEESDAAYLRALEIKPDYAPVHWNLGLNYLLEGKLDAGWQENEWRWKCAGFPSPKRRFREPMWKGEALGGRTILLHAEQGFGDTIQFARYVPLVEARGGHVILQCQKELALLFQSSFKGVETIPMEQTASGFDFHCPLMSLPLVFETRLETIPAEQAYLAAEGAAVDRWRARHSEMRGIRVGLAWAGSPTHKRDRQRSIVMERLLPLAAVKGVHFFSLQKGVDIDRSCFSKFGIIDVADELKDFAQTAAVMANLDLVISVDTAVAHLAGALGKNVWTLLPWVPDWRWLLGRDDSPWYPTMRLFRQTQRGDWGIPIERAAQALKELVESADQRGSS
jgi:tetratricopeptide (TPR) repeat protein